MAAAQSRSCTGPTVWSWPPGRAAPQALEDEPAGNAGHPAALAPAADLLALDVRAEDAAPHKRGGLEPVTMQVTTPPGDGRRSATYSDTVIT